MERCNVDAAFLIKGLENSDDRSASLTLINCQIPLKLETDSKQVLPKH